MATTFTRMDESTAEQWSVIGKETMEHQGRVADSVLAFAEHLAVPLGILHDSRNFAHQHFGAVYFDLQRSGWYEEETIRESLQGRFWELTRSKLAYIGVVEDHEIARRWRSLRDCPPGSWGREVASFYERHGFRVVEEADPPEGGPHVWFMRRDPFTGMA